MIAGNDIADRLEELVMELFPEDPVYRELCPNGFTRPCTLIVQDGCEVGVGYSPRLVELRPTFTLTAFVEVDEYHHSHLTELHRRQTALLGLFLPGYIKAAGRAPKVDKLNLGGGYDYDTVTVRFSVIVDRMELMEQENAPSAEHIEARAFLRE